MCFFALFQAISAHTRITTCFAEIWQFSIGGSEGLGVGPLTSKSDLGER